MTQLLVAQWGYHPIRVFSILVRLLCYLYSFSLFRYHFIDFHKFWRNREGFLKITESKMADPFNVTIHHNMFVHGRLCIKAISIS